MTARHDDDLEEFVTARTQDLHHDAYLLTASQDDAEHLLARVLADLHREHTDLTQAATTARQRMARAAARADLPPADDLTDTPSRFRPLAALTSRQRAILTLEHLDGHDLHSAGNALHLTARDLEESYAAIPTHLSDGDPTDLRRLLNDFGDQVQTPDPTTTLDQIRAIPPPPRRPWWTYAAALLVVALTVTTVWTTQTWHKNWLHTAEGLNHAHGTHFPAYTHGYKLVDIRDIEPGTTTETVDLSANDAVATECAHGQADQTTVASVANGINGTFMIACTAVGRRQRLIPVSRQTVVSLKSFSETVFFVAVYRKVTWDDYLVATNDFTVERGQTLKSLRPSDDKGDPIRPMASGAVLTLHGSSTQPNGTFTGTLQRPPHADNTLRILSGLLSPTTTGQFALLIGGKPPVTTCGELGPAIYGTDLHQRVCSVWDHTVPQIEYSTEEEPSGSTPLRVELTVKHARGPWTLQLVSSNFRLDSDGQVVP